MHCNTERASGVGGWQGSQALSAPLRPARPCWGHREEEAPMPRDRLAWQGLPLQTPARAKVTLSDRNRVGSGGAQRAQSPPGHRRWSLTHQARTPCDAVYCPVYCPVNPHLPVTLSVVRSSSPCVSSCPSCLRAPHRPRSAVSSRSLAWPTASKLCRSALASFQAARPRLMKPLRVG